MKTLFVTDLDGTLLNSESLVSAKSAEMLNDAIRKGALFSVATARTPSTVASLLGDVRLSLPLIVMTGAALWDPLSGNFSHSVTMQPETASGILSILRDHHLPAFIYCLKEDKIHILHSGPMSEMERTFMEQRNGSRYKIFHVPESGESDIPDPLTGVSLFYTVYPTGMVREAYLDIKDKIDCNPIFYHDHHGKEFANLEIFSPLTSKANALRLLKRISGAERVVAFGDNINDLPMLKEADVAVAVENAVEEVKRTADIIIGPNTDDSVARFILESTIHDLSNNSTH